MEISLDFELTLVDLENRHICEPIKVRSDFLPSKGHILSTSFPYLYREKDGRSATAHFDSNYEVIKTYSDLNAERGIGTLVRLGVVARICEGAHSYLSNSPLNK